MEKTRKRKMKSLKDELLIKSREAMLSAVQIFNNPNMMFKSESFIVLSNISWMYLLHAFYKKKNVDYRYYTLKNQRKKYDKTKYNAFKRWELERCLDDDNCPIDKNTKDNLKFLIGLRHEIEHQMTTKIDEYLSARFQACCLNYNNYIKKFFGEQYGIDKYLSFSLQFSTINEEHLNQLRDFSDLPKNIATYINVFDENLSDQDYNDIRYSYRVLFVPKNANHKGQADKVIEFIKKDSPEAEGLNKEFILIKEREKRKYLPKEIVSIINEKGYGRFRIYEHTLLWKEKDAKNPNKGFGTSVSGTWYWYENWLLEVEKYCSNNKDSFS